MAGLVDVEKIQPQGVSVQRQSWKNRLGAEAGECMYVAKTYDRVAPWLERGTIVHNRGWCCLLCSPRVDSPRT